MRRLRVERLGTTQARLRLLAISEMNPSSAIARRTTLRRSFERSGDAKGDQV
jgi:hypothetical protein